jgi:hypothetical protein
MLLSRDVDNLVGGREKDATGMQDLELIAQELSAIGERVSRLENRMSDLLTRMGDIEKVNGRLEAAALTTARSLQEISGHWDAVYEAMRRTEKSEEAREE